MHVVDASSPQAESQRRVAEEVLGEMGVTADRIFLVANKSDLPRLLALDAEALAISARTGAGLDALRAAILARLEALGVAAPFYGRGMA